jgi:hypothetical protein
VSSGRRITIALVGLVLLAVVGYLVTDLGHGRSGHGGPGSPTTVSITATTPPPAG